MIKMAVFDMDGTLLKNDYSLSENTINMFKLLKEKNIKAVLASGRPHELLKQYTHLFDIDGYTISCNGSVIYNQKTDDYLHFSSLPGSVVKDILDYAKKKNIDILLYGKGYILSSDNERYHFFMDKNNSLSKELRGNIILINDFEKDIIEESINKILLVDNDKIKYKEALDYVSKLANVTVTRSKSDFIDIGPKNNTKGNAILLLCEKYNISTENVIAFGDQYNDTSMFETVKYSVAMGNANDEVKSYARYIADTNENDGVYKKIIELI